MSDLHDTAPDPPVNRDESVALFRRMVALLDRCDYPGASEARRELHRRGWLVIPPATWPKGVTK